MKSDYHSGGLNLNPGHFSQLSMVDSDRTAPPLTVHVVALMCLAQIVYQFYLYP